MGEHVLDDLFREYGNDKPYYGSWQWFEEKECNRRIRELLQEVLQCEKNEREEAIRAKWTRKDYPFGSG